MLALALLAALSFGPDQTSQLHGLKGGKSSLRVIAGLIFWDEVTFFVAFFVAQGIFSRLRIIVQS